MKNLLAFELLSIIKPLNIESQNEVFITFLQLDFEELWFNISFEDLDKLRKNGDLNFGWSLDAKQVSMNNSTKNNF